jgi:hypothetical protein
MRWKSLWQIDADAQKGLNMNAPALLDKKLGSGIMRYERSNIIGLLMKQLVNSPRYKEVRKKHERKPSCGVEPCMVPERRPEFTNRCRQKHEWDYDSLDGEEHVRTIPARSAMVPQRRSGRQLCFSLRRTA